jgi:Hint domain
MDAMARLSGLVRNVDAPARAGMAAGTGIRTLDGTIPVEYLEPGDRVVTRSGARRLMAVSVRKHQGEGLIRIRVSTLGHDRPEHDLLIAEGQHVFLRDWRARLLFGTDVVAVPAARLADGEFILRESGRPVAAPVYLYTLRFDQDEVIWASGLELVCPAVVPAEPVPFRAGSQPGD